MEIGKIFVVMGLLLAGIGSLLWLGADKWGIGRLPGDIHIERENFSFHFPLVTCLLISVVLSILVMLVRQIWR